MKIVYHKVDNDGRAAASIIYREFGLMAMMNKSDFIGFDYNKGIEFPELDPGKPEIYFFVDISLNPETFTAIKNCIYNGCKVYHIDHHRNDEFIEELSYEDKSIMKQVVKFYDINESATLLCWIFTHMDAKQREDPMSVNYEFSDGYTHFIFDGDTSREMSIPIGFRYVNDQDMRHDEFPDTRAFTAGIINIESQRITYLEYDSIHPMSKVWVEIFRSNRKFLTKIIEIGYKVINADEKIYAELRKTAFETDMALDGVIYKIICINTELHSSIVAGEMFNEYDAYCRFSFDEDINKWTYTFYSRSEGKFLPCHLMCKSLDKNGGGHLHAAGCTKDINIFE